MPDIPKPDTLVVIPTLNEAPHLPAVLAAVDRDPAVARFKVVVADGGSVDGTQAYARQARVGGRAVQVLHNDRRIQAAAINAAVKQAGSGFRYLIRLDAHAIYPDGFISGVLATLQSGIAESCVVSMRTVGGNAMQNAGRDLFSSRLGHGGARHRSGGVGGYVEHGHHAGFLIDAFRAVGGYDENFTANEDAEFDLRFRAARKRVYLDGALTVDYIPRPSLTSTARQFFRNGYYRTTTLLKHRRRPQLRQLIPMCLMPAMYLSSLLALWRPEFLLIPVLYLGLLLVGASNAASEKQPVRILRIALLAAASHLGFSLGAMTCGWDWLRRRHHLRAREDVDATESEAT